MSIEASTLDEFDSASQFQRFDSNEISWNGHTISILQGGCQKDRSIWAAAQNLVNHYLHKAHLHKEPVSFSANVITCPISLSTLLSQAYQDMLNPPDSLFSSH